MLVEIDLGPKGNNFKLDGYAIHRIPSMGWLALERLGIYSDTLRPGLARDIRVEEGQAFYSDLRNVGRIVLLSNGDERVCLEQTVFDRMAKTFQEEVDLGLLPVGRANTAQEIVQLAYFARARCGEHWVYADSFCLTLSGALDLGREVFRGLRFETFAAEFSVTCNTGLGWEALRSAGVSVKSFDPASAEGTKEGDGEVIERDRDLPYADMQAMAIIQGVAKPPSSQEGS